MYKNVLGFSRHISFWYMDRRDRYRQILDISLSLVGWGKGGVDCLSRMLTVKGRSGDIVGVVKTAEYVLNEA